ncbi:MAG: NADH-quinone oxidoreductase subunit NuoH [Gemmatimonadales bacterium]|nr:NADH-quinone oxidoreductase subunit NuoH [Gemmatimonadales bacterium]MBP6570218.1 NADH-quinone oxidoreductase subunit NuoH [Gemmatimonadales bacterium]MBP7619668.1 NADH-quinone oxidoreductase subunit NuoH [Gemmatimonadales bacterium]
MKGFLLVSVVRLLVIFTVLLVGVALMTLMERKVAGWMQNRPGPNRVGPFGILQPAADGLKNFIKEETRPAGASGALFMMAPAFSFIPALMLLGVIPLAAPLPLHFDITLPLIGRATFDGPMTISIADVPIGFLFVLAISSLGVYGVALAGWASNSKYSLLGGLRASAQMISYEVAMGLSLIPLLLMTGNVSFSEIIAKQQAGLWFVGPLFISFFVFLIAGFAETNRLPFDLPEAESELVAGYHSEYSAMKFSMFMIAEFAHIVTISAMLTTLFFGGWDIPFTTWDQQGGLAQTLVTHLFFFGKMFFWIFFVMWIRWTLPRFRYDQLMSLGWKVLLPLALAYILVTAGAIWGLDRGLGWTTPRAQAFGLLGLNVVLGWLLIFVLDRGRIVRGVSTPIRPVRLAARTTGEE